MFLALQEEEILFFCATFTASGFTGGQSCQKGLSWHGRFLRIARIARVSKKGFHGKASFSENPEFPKGLSRHGRFKLTIHWQNASCSEMFYKERTINGRQGVSGDGPKKEFMSHVARQTPYEVGGGGQGGVSVQ